MQALRRVHAPRKAYDKPRLYKPDMEMTDDTWASQYGVTLDDSVTAAPKSARFDHDNGVQEYVSSRNDQQQTPDTESDEDDSPNSDFAQESEVAFSSEDYEISASDDESSDKASSPNVESFSNYDGEAGKAVDVLTTDWIQCLWDDIQCRAKDATEHTVRTVEGHDPRHYAAWRERLSTKRLALGKVKWTAVGEQAEQEGGYEAAMIDDEIIRPGDFVLVRPEHGKPAAAGTWFARVVRIFARGIATYAHVHWLAHGADTILAGTAGSNELFVLESCDDIPLGSISAKIQIDYVDEERRRAMTDRPRAVELKYSGKINHFFYRFGYFAERHHRFEPAEAFTAPESLEKELCLVCRKAAKEPASPASVKVKPGTGRLVNRFDYAGITYAELDFVYFHDFERDAIGNPYPAEPKKAEPKKSESKKGKPKKVAVAPYRIGQILKIEIIKQSPSGHTTEVRVTAQEFLRHDDCCDFSYIREAQFSEPHARRDQRRLYYPGEKLWKGTPEFLKGKCLIRQKNATANLSEFKHAKDAFYLDDPPLNAQIRPMDDWRLPRSPGCDSAYDEQPRLTRDFEKRGAKLRGMDIFAGPGGFTAGLRQSGAVETKWAIELYKHACETYRQNFPHVHVYNSEAGHLLREALEGRERQTREWDRDKVPRLPEPGDVDLIYGGCPCQDFSALNRYPRADSKRNPLVATFVGYVDYYRPKYFLFENVPGIQHTALGATQASQHKVAGGIKGGFFKFLLRSLTSLGYQTQYTVLNAEEHGVPQLRRRLFIWASLTGLTLPGFPAPCHLYSGCRRNGQHRLPYTARRSAPHKTLSVGDAIVDLPRFDWYNIDESMRNWNRSQAYSSEPVTNYQWQQRRNVTGSLVQNHYTYMPAKKLLDQVYCIPIRPGANHEDLPHKEAVDRLRNSQQPNPKDKNVLKRLDYDEAFSTCFTKLNPMSDSGGICIHPAKHRVLTVREYARAQGFPDTFIWKDPDTNHDWKRANRCIRQMYKQIGNAVPVPLARALGGELLEVLLKEWSSNDNSTQSDHEDLDYEEMDSIDEEVIWEEEVIRR